MDHFEKFFNYIYFKIFKKYPNDDVPKYLSGKGKWNASIAPEKLLILFQKMQELRYAAENHAIMQQYMDYGMKTADK